MTTKKDFEELRQTMKMSAYEIAVMASIKSLFETQKKIRVLYSYEIVKGEGYGHYYCPDTKLYVKIRKGRIVNRLSEDTDEKGRFLVYAENQRVLVPASEIIEIGYN
jgi:hypothetical protein